MEFGFKQPMISSDKPPSPPPKSNPDKTPSRPLPGADSGMRSPFTVRPTQSKSNPNTPSVGSHGDSASASGRKIYSVSSKPQNLSQIARKRFGDRVRRGMIPLRKAFKLLKKEERPWIKMLPKKLQPKEKDYADVEKDLTNPNPNVPEPNFARGGYTDAELERIEYERGKVFADALRRAASDKKVEMNQEAKRQDKILEDSGLIPKNEKREAMNRLQELRNKNPK